MRKDYLTNRRFYKSFGAGRAKYNRRPNWQPNPFTIDAEGKVLVDLFPLSYGWKTRLEPEDYEKLKEYRMRVSAEYAKGVRYAFISCMKAYLRKNFESKKAAVKLGIHDILLQPKYGNVVDHIKHDAATKIVDNTRMNIRIASMELNSQNSGPSRRNVTGVKGVSMKKDTGFFTVRFYHDGRSVSFKNQDNCFSELKDAALCRDYLNQIFKTGHPINYPGVEIPGWIADRVEARLHEIGWKV